MDERIYSKNIIEFVTVSAEYCAFIERVPELEKEEFLDKIIKILPLLYPVSYTHLTLPTN